MSVTNKKIALALFFVQLIKVHLEVGTCLQITEIHNLAMELGVLVFKL